MHEKTVRNKVVITAASAIAIIASNILVVKPITLFGFLPTTCAFFAFPLTYILSDVVSEVYGYKWSRFVATVSSVAMAIVSALFMFSVWMPSDADTSEAVAIVLGNTPFVAAASILAYWVGDLFNDRVFAWLKEKNSNFALRAVGSSLIGKYVDDIVFTNIACWSLPLAQRAAMIAWNPFAQIVLELALVPITALICKKLSADMTFEEKVETA